MKIGPKSEFQARYLNSNADIIIAGGAAGSSKSFVGLMRHLRFVNDPMYRGFCIRKNSAAIMKSGGLFDEAVFLYGSVFGNEMKIKLKDQKLVFPSGAEVSFTHYENDSAANNFQGLQLSSVFYDEATHADEKHIWWLISRLRSKAKMKPTIWLTCNPDPDSYLRAWVDPWLYPEGHEKAGLCDPDKNGSAKYILRVGGDIMWGDTAEELQERFGKYKKVTPKRVEVHLGTIYDNPTLMRTNPEYLSNLEALPNIEMQRLLLGNWNVREQSSSYFNRNWVEEVAYVEPSEIVATARTFDFAETLKSELNTSPDYTVTTLMHKMKDGSYVVSSVKRHRIRSGDWIPFILEHCKDDPPMTTYYLPLDPGPMAKRSHMLLKRDLAELGIYAVTINTNKSKLERFRPFSAFAQTGDGMVKFVKNCGIDYENKIVNDNKFIYNELEAFTGERKKGENGHDDIVDTISDGFYALARNKTLGSFHKTATNLINKVK